MTETLAMHDRDGRGHTWNHRIVLQQLVLGEAHEDCYAIHEVYYDSAGQITFWTEEPVAAVGGTRLECLDTLAVMFRAASLPVVDVRSGEAVEI